MEDFSSEIRTIKEAITEAENMLDILYNDDLVQESFGDEIQGVLSSLSSADTEINYIEDNISDPDDYVCKDDVRSMLEDMISNVRYM